ncbi:MAG TPA: carboxymuconolactone decarboxylase family protein [Candidatus Blautia faecavium]|uniref:Carboxymuconolactone decarboxylase family protein n=1 Tax=Candidatus Blautia faecavium TaxID=2838487 RepID=A0A9D2RXL3_9FIRM|nr:carboxymuconolactone decarboxylase family protein [Candidatus Blautia faecavium]
MAEYEKLRGTDPEFMERWEAFAFDEVVNEPGQQLDDETRYLAILSVLMGCQGIDAYKCMLPESLKAGLTPVMVKEMVYQAVDYLGFGRVYPFLNATNECFSRQGISLPLEGQSTTTMENRLEKGSQAQVDIFGEGMKDFWKGGHMNRWLAANCFGDFYTRTGLDLKQREMITFCFLYAQGGCEPQAISHAQGNIRLGNDAEFLTKVVSQCVPYVGYPRSLNAIQCIKKAAEQ